MDNSEEKSLKREEAEAIIAGVEHLIDDPKFKPFFFRKLYELGPTRFMEIADQSRHADYPSRKFARTLKTTKVRYNG